MDELGLPRDIRLVNLAAIHVLFNAFLMSFAKCITTNYANDYQYLIKV